MQSNRLLHRIFSTILPAVFLVACIKPPPAQRTARVSDAAGPISDTRITIGTDLYIREIQAGAFVITHSFPWPANSLLVAMENGDLVFVDTPYTPEATQDVLDWIEGRLGARKIVAVNTGFHYDNLGGNSCLVERGIPVYGSELTVKLLEERGERMRALTLDWLRAPRDRRFYTAYESLRITAPTHIFAIAGGLRLVFGEETIRVCYPGASHTPDNVVVFFPERRLLFGTCMVIGTNEVGNTADADPEAWIASVRALTGFACDIVVPGHGERLDPGLLAHTIDLLTRYGKK